MTWNKGLFCSSALPEDLVEDALLRLPPDDPASLARAALVSKEWCRIIRAAHHGFSRRFRELQRSPPLLGFLCNSFDATGGARCVPTSSFRPTNADRRRGLWRAAMAEISCGQRGPWPPLTLQNSH